MKLMINQKPRFMNNRYVKFFASIRFAIPVLLTFAVAMVVGTVCESLYGTEFVRRAIYHTWWFYLIQFSIGLSVLLAMLDRLPYKKKLTGFYIVHISLITIMIGSVITHFWGIDGSIELREKEYTSGVRLNEDYAYLWDGQIQHTYRLPDNVLETRLNHSFPLAKGATAQLITYLPYAGKSSKWIRSQGFWATTWLLKNDRFEQKVELVDGPTAPARERFGPLQMEVVPKELIYSLKAVNKPQKNSFIFLDEKTGKSYAIPENATGYTPPGSVFRFTKISSEKMKLTYYEVKTPNGTVKFFPRFSTKPISNHLEVDRASPYNLIDISRFGETNTVLISPLENNQILMAFGKDTQWTFVNYDSKPVNLPWMGFSLTLLDQHVNERPDLGFEAARPNREDEKNMKALLVRVTKDGQSEDVWLTNREATGSMLGLQESFIGSKELKLLISMKLERFKMDLVPGTTNKPASYESFVRTKEFGKGEKEVHIYMNNPYKTMGYTFYQASYLQDDQGAYHSILSVNKDPGRPVKYAGSLLLVLGLILHFSIIYGYIKVA